MKRLIVSSFLVIILFTNCIKNKNTEQTQDSQSKIGQELSTIDEIHDYIFNDLRLKHTYNNLDELLATVNISGDYTIKERTAPNILHALSGFLYIYDVEWDHYGVSIFTSDQIDIYFIAPVKIEINDKNYLHLFPYEKFEEYMADDAFGENSSEIREVTVESPLEDNIISYVIRSNIYTSPYDNIRGYCDLIFKNGLLKSIRIVPFAP
ncbi:MAG: hypothetical protein LBI28_00600 [Treponema sp.]|jgi:hypothetical protein|nr:hypothetical protein [Treponema sp.]